MNERPDLTLNDFPRRRLVFSAEGGGVFIDERNMGFYVITDESATLDLLSDEDAAGIPGVTIREFASAAERDAYLAGRGWIAKPIEPTGEESVTGVNVRWYGERGIVNALVNHVAKGTRPVETVRALLSAVRWAAPQGSSWIGTFTSATLIVELGLADFGNPDLLVVCNGPDGVRLVFIEAKIAPYLASMRPNRQGMQSPGFNSSINGQLALKYRFARGLESTLGDVLSVVEPDALLPAYAAGLADPRTAPRRLAKATIVRDMLKPVGLLGVPESHCSYVALTWDAPERVFFGDHDVERLDGRPLFLDEHGRDLWSQMSERIGWLGYGTIDAALRVRDDSDYQKALATMVETVVPTDADYATALEALGQGAPEAVPLMAQLASLFKNHEVVEYKGSYSVKDHGQTIGKIIRRGTGVFVGLRDTINPAPWFPGPLEEISVQGVVFRGVIVPADSPDSRDAATLVSGLG